MLRLFAVDKDGRKSLLHARVSIDQLAAVTMLGIRMGYTIIADVLTPRAAISRHLLTYI
jgi:hypothetical protein